MKRIFTLVLATAILGSLIFCAPVSAVENEKITTTEVEYLENGDYIETTIETQNTTRAAGTVTGSKTKSYKDSDGTVLWKVKVTGTFAYTGKTSLCSTVSHTATSNSSSWTIKSSSSSKSGNVATATAKAVNTSSTTITNTLTVKLTCDADGNLS